MQLTGNDVRGSCALPLVDEISCQLIYGELIIDLDQVRAFLELKYGRSELSDKKFQVAKIFANEARDFCAT